MPTNTKARHEEIYTAAVSALETVGGVEAVDRLPNFERLVAVRKLYKQVAETTNCHIDTSKRNVAKAMRRARYSEMQKHWGGERPGAGRPRNETP